MSDRWTVDPDRCAVSGALIPGVNAAADLDISTIAAKPIGMAGQRLGDWIAVPNSQASYKPVMTDEMIDRVAKALAAARSIPSKVTRFANTPAALRIYDHSLGAYRNATQEDIDALARENADLKVSLAAMNLLASLTSAKVTPLPKAFPAAALQPSKSDSRKMGL